GAAAAEAARDGDALPDPRAPAWLDRGCGPEPFERGADQRVVGEAVDAQHIGPLDRDAVAQRDSLVDRRDLVLAVRARRADDEGEVDLRGGGRAVHASASARATNSSGASSSARVASPRSIAARTRAAFA